MRKKIHFWRILFACACIFLFLLFGCVKVDTYEQFYQNGRSRVVSQIYIKNLVNVLSSSSISAPNNDSWAQYFERECNSLQANLSGATCHVSQDWLIFDDSRVSGSGYVLTYYESFPYTIYELTVLSPPLPPLETFKGAGQFDLPNQTEFSKFNDTDYSQIISSGLSYNYVISLPGEVIETSHGSYAGGAVSVNALDVIKSQSPIRIKSRDLNFWQLFAVLGGGVSLFLIFDFAIIWFLKEWSRRKESGKEVKNRRESAQWRFKVFRPDMRLKGNEVYKAQDKSSGKD